MKILTLLQISIKSLLNRKWIVSLVIFSITISTILLLGIEKTRIDIKNNFMSSISGTDLIVGARGSPIQLLLYSVFHLGRSTNNINQKTIDYIVNHEYVDWSVPISLGDTYKKFPVVATEKVLFDKYKYDYDKQLTLKEGNIFNGDFEVVIGHDVAQKTKLEIGNIINLSHGNSDQEHKENFKVVGILQVNGTPIDTSIIITLNAMDIIHAGYLPQKRQITSMLIGLKEKRKIFSIQREFNNYKNEPLTAILPGVVLEEMWFMLSIFEKSMFFISSFVMIGSLLGLSATILAGLNERKREITILRVLGANPIDICFLVIFELLFVIFIGILLGIIFLYILIFLLSPFILLKYGIKINMTILSLNESLFLIKIFLVGFIVCLIPIFKTYLISLKSGLK
jgi:putative ABC transport system permease protein